MSIDVRTPGQEADLSVRADLSQTEELPEGSPFRSLVDARKFADPLACTFDSDTAADKMLVVRGLRKAWDPRPERSRSCWGMPWLMMGAARASMGLGQVMAKATSTPYPHVMRKLKFTTFAVKMLLIDRWLDISRAERDLEYVPLLPFDEGWAQTIAYFREREAAA